MSAVGILDTAQTFLWTTARLLERLRFEHVFRGLPAEPVIAALRAYRNPDGGFGNALEPDFRGPVSQPTTSDFALRVLDELGVPDPGLVGPLADWLPSVTTAEGGTPTVLANGAGYPRAPWWDPDPEQRACLLPTAGLAGFLHRYGLEHPWLAGATDFTWAALERVPDRLAAGDWTLQVGYEVRCAVAFLDAVPDRDRAIELADRLGPALVAGGALILDPAETGEAMLPLDVAPRPDSVARRWFDQATVEAHLDAIVAGQQPDGGWTVPWEFWTPATGPEWRGIQTVERLKTLQAYGRL